MVQSVKDKETLQSLWCSQKYVVLRRGSKVNIEIKQTIVIEGSQEINVGDMVEITTMNDDYITGEILQITDEVIELGNDEFDELSVVPLFIKRIELL